MKIQPNGLAVASDLPPLSEEGRREAVFHSGQCEHCGGGGLVLVDATDPDVRAQTVAATCECVHGRWIRAWHTVNDRAILDRVPDLVAILGHRDSRWRLCNDAL